MQFKLGAKVYTSDNRQVGTVDHIVLEPEKKEVTHLVVRKGLLFGKDKVIPVSAVQSEASDGLVLQQDSSNLDGFPDFEESHYAPSEGDTWAEARHAEGPSNRGTSYLVGGAPISVSPMDAPRNVAKTRNIPDETVPLKSGSKVISSDGQNVGSVERVITDTSAGQATDLIILQGLLLKTKKQIPAEWITNVMEDEVHLKVDASFIQSLPEYQPELQ